MSSLEIILVLAVLPATIMVLLSLLTLGPHLRRTPRYRPGQEWNHPPLWWTADPEALRDVGFVQHRSVTRAGRGGCRGNW